MPPTERGQGIFFGIQGLLGFLLELEVKTHIGMPFQMVIMAVILRCEALVVTTSHEKSSAYFDRLKASLYIETHIDYL